MAAERFTGRDAIERADLRAYIRVDARKLAGIDDSLCDDLQQHGCLVVLSMKGKHTLSFYRNRANWRMSHYQRYERRRLNHAGLEAVALRPA